MAISYNLPTIYLMLSRLYIHYSKAFIKHGLVCMMEESVIFGAGG